MKLRKKTLLILAFCWILAFGLIIIVSFLILQHQFAEIEKKFINTGFIRINQALQNKIEHLEQINLDWSPWDDNYQYMQNKKPDFIQSNISNSVFYDTKVELFLFLNMDGTIHFAKYYDNNTLQFLELPHDLVELINADKILFPRSKLDFIKGMILLNNQVWFIAANYILTTDKKSEPAGVFVNGMKLSGAQLDNLSQTTEFPLQLTTINDANKNPALKTIVAETEKYGTYYKFAGSHVNGYMMLKDVFGKNIALLTAKMPHDIYLQGKNTIITYLLCLFIIACIISFLIVLLLRKFIINRLEVIEKQITTVNLSAHEKKRGSISGDDELTRVASSVNGMLEIIETSQTELENRVKQRTKELSISNKALVKNREKLEQLARYDTLTGLPNRATFYELLHSSIKDAKRNKQKLAIIFLDLDNFKNINDTLGHHVGDEVLVRVGELLKKNLRENDLLARLGGDEFIICLKNLIEPTDVHVAVEKIIHEFSKPLFLSARQFNITPSIGISIYPDDDTTVEKLLSNADLAMYRAKAQAKNSYQFFTRALNQLVVKKLEMEHNLREAIKEEQIEAFFQPIISLDSAIVTYSEALARWNHPIQGLISPIDFIPVAEETGLIHTMGELIVKDVARKQKFLFEQYGFNLNIAINFSAIQFNEPGFSTVILDYIKKYELNPQKITIEITESAIMQRLDEVIKKLTKLKELGFKLSIDDFGTGYSSLSYLKTFKVDYIKIDKSFLSDIETSAANQNIITAVIFLSHSLGMKVIAEGVETNFALEFLKEKKCDMAQGYIFSKPLPFSKFVDEFVKN